MCLLSYIPEGVDYRTGICRQPSDHVHQEEMYTAFTEELNQHIQEKIRSGMIHLKYCPTTEMVADILPEAVIAPRDDGQWSRRTGRPPDSGQGPTVR